MAGSFAEGHGLGERFHLDRLPELLAWFDDERVHTVLVSMCDASGTSRVKAISLSRFADAAHNGVAYQSGVLSLDLAADFAPGTGFDFELAGQSFLLLPDCASAFLTPWSPGTAVVMADPYFVDGRCAGAAPRPTLRRLLDQLARRGYEVSWGWEFEFYTFTREHGELVPTTPDSQALNQIRYRQAEPLIDLLRTNLAAAGIELTDMIHEYGPGQLEVNFEPAAGLYGVDRAFFFRLAVKEILQRNGVIATFMTKPLSGRSASGCHIHVSLTQSDGSNAFSDPAHPEGISMTLLKWIAGQITNARELTALVTPTINGYKRYVPNSFAPSNISWGFENRTTMIRIPLERGPNTRIENRLPEAATNPYIAAAGLLATGLLGLDQEPNTDHFVTGNAHDRTLPPLPDTLHEALTALRTNTQLSELLGQDFLRLYLAVKDNELRRYQAHITDWETNEYLELL